MLEEELRAASASGILQNVTSLLQKGAVFSADSCGRTPLHLAAACGHKDIVETLVHPKHINATDSVGRTPLQIAATGGHVEVVRALLKNGANPNSRDKLHGNTSLHEASWHGFSQTVALLTEHKATTDVRNSAGFAPLHLACQNGHNQTCRELLLANANPDIQNNYGDTALHTSARYGHAGVARILISASCRVSDQNKNGDTPLQIAAAMGRRKLTTILLEAGCDKTIRNKQYETACDIATRKDLNEIIIILQNVKPNKSNKKKSKKTSETSDSDKKSKETAPRVAHDPRACGSAVRWSPYGCHYYPDPNAFPQPRLDSLPGEPLSKGEQYYLDLAGNIRKGPVGVGLTCYCANFLRDMETRLEKSNSELRRRIKNTRCELEQRVTRTEGLLAEWLGTAAATTGNVGETRQSRKNTKGGKSNRRRGRSHSLDLLSNAEGEEETGIQKVDVLEQNSRRSSMVIMSVGDDKEIIEEEEEEDAEGIVFTKLLETELSGKLNELSVQNDEQNQQMKYSQRNENKEDGKLWENATPPYREIEKLPYRSRVGVYSPTFMGLSDQDGIDNLKNSQSTFYVPECVNKINEKNIESQESHNLQGANLV